jgi:uncharacterized protein (UPF0210 family)
LFNVALEKVIRETSLDIRGTTLHKSLQILAYVDDIIGRYERTVKEVYGKLMKAAQQMRLTTNKVSNNKTKEKHIIIDNKMIK